MEVFLNMNMRTTVTWNSILAGFSSKPGKLKEAEDLFNKIPEPDTVSYNVMLGCYFKNAAVEAAKDFFLRIPVKDIASWNTMISGAGGNESTTYARSPFYMKSKMRSVYLEGYNYSVFDLTKHDAVQIQDWVGKGRWLSGHNYLAGLGRTKDKASEKGLPVCRHLFLHYPGDEYAQRLTYEQFLVGTEMLVVPVLDKGKEVVKGLFPRRREMFVEAYLDRKTTLQTRF
ncbi:hypothetical protein Salat_2931600 [Sesamum alatum]|uniref:Glycosyl hydrolase family 31 C-terminal domain-containing protein n=1 Tax=Sesamum alatum TaxID=300844 RepID=A0AAE1XK30_9LAMI|nr:hypothetical protein Salat_2931600 [Sesamum alatum]